MPLDRVEVHGIVDLEKWLADHKGRTSFILFTGSHVDGKSWCPDCVVAEPVIEKVLKNEEVAATDATFITCFVGALPYWKDPACPFRTHPIFKVTCVPTLIKYNSKHHRLIDDQLTNEHIIKDMILDE